MRRTRSRAKCPLPQARHRSGVVAKPFQRYLAVFAAGCPSFGGQRTVVASRRQWPKRAPDVTRFEAKNQTPAQASALACTVTAGPARSRSTKAQCQFGRRPCGPRCQRRYASACKHKAKVRLVARGLTLPSRGRPTGYALRPPLMSNVRRRSPTNEGRSRNTKCQDAKSSAFAALVWLTMWPDGGA
jgi:hypothetical protein